MAGHDVAATLAAGLGPRPSRQRRMAALAGGLERHGHEPRREGRAVVPGNCSFHALAQRHRNLVCGMNLGVLEGVVDGVGATNFEPRRDPRPGQCCVTVSATRRT